ncbi:MAG: MBL fold metallo-hydrolase [Candidatus Omnitrophota bacterium]|nr:MBL fold metallo-hydrolase [Candidatus Omnitrophota bacterium]
MPKRSPRTRNKLFIQNFVVGPLETNCYLVADPATKEACLIDPGADPDILKKALDKNGFRLKFIINTHGHADHIAANDSFDVPLYIHKLDKDFLADPVKNMSRAFLFNIVSRPAAKLLEDGDKLGLGGLTLEVIHTPGHTPGSISLKLEDVIFTGDALFQQSVGRTDFPYGDGRALIDSIKKRLLIYSDDTEIYPGHGGPSTIEAEKAGNPFIAE